jgi:hypothetical protein
MAKFRVENVLSALTGIRAGKNQVQQQMAQEKQQQQMQVMSLIPQLLQQEQMRRQEQMAPFDELASRHDLTPESMQSVLQARGQARQGLGAPTDATALFAQIFGGKDKNLTFPGMSGGVGVPVPQVALRDPRAEQQALTAEQRRYEESQDAARQGRENEAATLRYRREGVQATAGRYENPAAFNDYYEKGEIPARPPMATQLPVPGGYGAKIPFTVPGAAQGIPTAAGELLDDKNARRKREQDELDARQAAEQERLRQAGRLRLAEEAGVRAARLAGIKSDDARFKSFVDIYSKNQLETGDPDYARRVAEAGVQGPGSTAPAPEARQTTKSTQADLNVAKTADIPLNRKTQDARAQSYITHNQSLDKLAKQRLTLDGEIRRGTLKVAQAKQLLESSVQTLKAAASANVSKDPLMAQKGMMLRQRVTHLEGQINKLNYAGITHKNPTIAQAARAEALQLTGHLNALTEEWRTLTGDALQKPDAATWDRAKEDRLQQMVKKYHEHFKRPAPADIRTKIKQDILEGRVR